MMEILLILYISSSDYLFEQYRNEVGLVSPDLPKDELKFDMNYPN